MRPSVDHEVQRLEAASTSAPRRLLAQRTWKMSDGLNAVRCRRLGGAAELERELPAIARLYPLRSRRRRDEFGWVGR